MKIFKLLIIVLVFVGISNGSFSQDTIHWRSDYKLKWEDFKGTPDTTSEFGAISSCQIFFKANIEQDNFLFNIYCFFEKQKSWKQPGVTSISLLKHERGHFDITEIFARMLRCRLKNYKLQPTTYQQDVKNIFKEILDEKIKMDAQYDNETSFSTNTAMQIQWEKKIQTILNSLSEFSAK